MNITKREIGELPHEWAQYIADDYGLMYGYRSPYEAIREAWDYAPGLRDKVEEALAAMIEAESNGK